MAAKKSGKKGKPLTPRQNAFIKALAKGSTQRDAAIKAGYKAKHPDQAAHQALKQIQGKVPQIMDLKPLVPEFSGLF
jgi:phage terminase small subunit